MKKAPQTPQKTFKIFIIGMCSDIFLRIPRSPKPGPNSQFGGALFFCVILSGESRKADFGVERLGGEREARASKRARRSRCGIWKRISLPCDEKVTFCIAESRKPNTDPIVATAPRFRLGSLALPSPKLRRAASGLLRMTRTKTFTYYFPRSIRIICSSGSKQIANG